MGFAAPGLSAPRSPCPSCLFSVSTELHPRLVVGHCHSPFLVQSELGWEAYQGAPFIPRPACLATWPLVRRQTRCHLLWREWEEHVLGVPPLDKLLSPPHSTLTPQSEEDKQLQDELEMLVERLGVSHVGYGACWLDSVSWHQSPR